MPTTQRLLGEYLESVGDDSLTNFQFDMTGGTAKGTYLVEKAAFNLQGVVQDILGYTNPYNTGVQNLRRILPVTHPQFPFLYGQRISSMVGKGTKDATRVGPVQPKNPTIGNNPIADFLRYSKYEIGVEFASRTYPVLADDAFTTSVNGTWFKKDGTQDDFTYAPEWCRYVDYDLVPCDNTLQGQVGNMSLWGVPAKAGGVTFPSPPWMWLPDQFLKVKWYQVPYRFITSSNSYIASTLNRNWRGRINQNAWWNWPVGSLLYMGFSVTKYTPPTIDIGTYPSFLPGRPSGTVNVGTLLNYERLCDIELTFLLTSRYPQSVGAAISNKNYVAAGHNMLPNLADNLFYYATRTDINGAPNVQNPPAWFSFPVEALFSDPDVAGGPTTTGDN